MCKQHNGSSAARLSELSRAPDRRQRFNSPFTHLHHAVFHFHPKIQVTMFLTYRGYPFIVTAKSDRGSKIHPPPTSSSVSEPRHSENTTVNISELLKAIWGRHSYFIFMSSYLKISRRVICFWRENGINIEFLKRLHQRAGDVSIRRRSTNKKLFSYVELW